MYCFKDYHVRMSVSQPPLIRSVRFMQVEPPDGSVRVTKQIESAMSKGGYANRNFYGGIFYE